MSEQTQRRLKPGEAEIAACCSGNHSQVTSWSWGPDVCLCVCAIGASWQGDRGTDKASLK